MNSNQDVVIGNTTIHKGTRYAGALQKGEVLPAEDRLTTLHAREQISKGLTAPPDTRIHKKKAKPDTMDKGPGKKGAKMDTREIMWVRKGRPDTFRAVTATFAQAVRDRSLQSSVYQPLFEDFLAAVGDALEDRLITVSVIARGVSTNPKDGLGPFIRVSLPQTTLDAEQSFVLPASFLEDCKKLML